MPAGPAAETRSDLAVEEVRDAISRLRTALDTLEASLETPKRESLAPAAGRTSSDPHHPDLDAGADAPPAAADEAAAPYVHDWPSQWPASAQTEEPASASLAQALASEPEAASAQPETPWAEPESPMSDGGAWTSHQAPAAPRPAWNTEAPRMEPGAWPYPPPSTAHGFAPPQEAPAEAASDPDDPREQVRRAVEQLRSEIESGLTRTETPDTTAEPADELAPEPAPAALQGLASDAAAQPPATAEVSQEDEDHRDQVRRAVEQMRAEIQDAGSGVQPQPASSHGDGDADVREQVRRDVEHIGGAGVMSEVGPEQPFDVREQVRRAVEEAKAEIESGRSGPDGTPAKSLADVFNLDKPGIPNHQASQDERFLQPAILVIDDPEGRVELVRVYRTLARLEVAATANLANYSSHSVTVQLEERKVPPQEDIADAVTYAFERDCSVDIDGNRASIRLFGGKAKVA